jgi:hypothetical protein
MRGWALLKCIRLSAHYRFNKVVPDVVACIAATARVELDCCSTAILEVWPIIEVVRFTFLVIAWHCFARLEHLFLCE